MIPQCIDQGVGVLPWSPLARGLLAGNRTREGEKLTTRAGTDPFGDSLYDARGRLRGRRPGERDRGRARRSRRAGGARLAAAAKPGVTAPIVGATKAGHVDDAVAAEALELTADEIARLEEPYVPHAVSGHE